MAKAELFVSDDYCQEVSKRGKNDGELFEALLDSYIMILKQARDNAICDGSAAQALVQYISYASSLKGCVEGLSTLAAFTVSSFITDIDAADSGLY